METVTAAIALGSNLGASYLILEKALGSLGQVPQIRLLRRSRWYQTKAVGPVQPDYLNGAALLEVSLTPQDLLNHLLAIEANLGRVREQHWGPRTLDLDLIFYGDRLIFTPNLEIPHPRFQERAFVLIPLREIAPDWVDPRSQKTVQSLCQEVDWSGVSLYQPAVMSLPPEPPEFLQKRLFYQGRVFAFEVNRLRLPKGVEGEWECVRHPGGALAVPLTPEGKLVLVKQYRFSVGERLLEFPAGTLEVGEDAAETVKRELEEEAGYRAQHWQSLGKFPLAPGYSDEYIYAFLATGLEKLTHPPQQDEDEDIEVVLMDVGEFEAAAKEGLPIDAKTMTSFFLARFYL